MNRKISISFTKQAVLVGAVLGLTMISCGKGNQSEQPKQVPSVGVITVNQTDAELESLYPTTIKGKKDVAIRPQVTGFITRVCVDEGQKVSAGQTLFILDQVQFQAAVSQAEAAVAVAQESVNNASLTASNKEKLFAKNIISEYENQMAKNQLSMAKSQLAQAKAALVTARKNLSYTVVTSPSAGFVGEIPNREGSLASPSSQSPLTTVSDISEVYAYISFNEKQVLKMTNGGETSLNEALAKLPDVKLKLSDGSIYPLPGKFTTLSGALDNMTGSASVRILFKNQNGMLRSGSTGSIVIPIRESNVFIIPQKATTEIQDKKYAYVVNDSNKVASTPITILPNNDGTNYVVTDGLKNGDRVVIEGVGMTIRDGVVINPVDANAQKQEAPAEKEEATEEKK